MTPLTATGSEMPLLLHQYLENLNIWELLAEPCQRGGFIGARNGANIGCLGPFSFSGVK
jgi:hypothetical protein